ncbi:hypothetical protein MFRU_013g00250 [Monilinia fructicola]|nr:hypothetical protein MFRU_013g00250 [Monilinia fructicola]
MCNTSQLKTTQTNTKRNKQTRDNKDINAAGDATLFIHPPLHPIRRSLEKAQRQTQKKERARKQTPNKKVISNLQPPASIRTATTGRSQGALPRSAPNNIEKGAARQRQRQKLNRTQPNPRPKRTKQSSNPEQPPPQPSTAKRAQNVGTPEVKMTSKPHIHNAPGGEEKNSKRGQSCPWTPQGKKHPPVTLTRH